jgi:hypothetical protein
MEPQMPLRPLDLIKSLGVPTYEVAARLGITPTWLRQLAKNPRHTRRIRVAELEACLEKEKLALSLESLLNPGGGYGRRN